MKKFLQEFKTFAMRGNVMDLAVGVIVGGAFSSITNSLINDIIMPIVGIFVSQASFADLTLSVGGAVITYGNFIQAVLHGQGSEPGGPYPEEGGGPPARTLP